MGKSDKQSKHLSKTAAIKREKTYLIVEAACRFLDDNPELDRSSYRTLSRVTKNLVVDPTGKGRTEATLKSAYLAPLLERYRVGPYALLEAESGIVDPLEYLELKKRIIRMEKELKVKSETIKNLNRDLKEQKVQNEVLRHDIMGMQTLIETATRNVPVNIV